MDSGHHNFYFESLWIKFQQTKRGVKSGLITIYFYHIQERRHAHIAQRILHLLDFILQVYDVITVSNPKRETLYSERLADTQTTLIIQY